MEFKNTDLESWGEKNIPKKTNIQRVKIIRSKYPDNTFAWSYHALKMEKKNKGAGLRERDQANNLQGCSHLFTWPLSFIHVHNAENTAKSFTSTNS